MSGSVRRFAAIAATIPVLAALVLAAAPAVSGGIAVGASLTIVKVTDPGNDPQDFDFDLTGAAVPADLDLDTDNGDGALPSQQLFDVSAEVPGAYTITETATSGWVLMGLVCTGGGGDSSVNLDTGTATINLDGGEQVVCTFMNGKLPLVMMTKVTDPASDPQDFYFDVKSIFNTSLDTDPSSLDTLDMDWTSLADDELGPRVLEETAVEGWTLTDISCKGDEEAQEDLGEFRVVLDVDAEEFIICTFTNTKGSDETEPPLPDEPTIEPTDESGGETDLATEPGTSTESANGDASTVGVGVALVALILLSGVLLLTRPRRAGK